MAFAVNLKSEFSAPVEQKSLPPMLQQYLEFKQQYPDCLVFFQVGDFYEAFFEDARLLSATLNVTLTSRDKTSADPIPMAGVPISAVEGYLTRLVAAGLSVALVSQTSSSDKSVAITRKLERIVTPGINISSKEVNDSGAASVAALLYTGVAALDREIAVAHSTIASAKIYVKTFQSFQQALGFIANLAPAELIIPEYIGDQKIDRRLPWVRRLELTMRTGQVKQKNLPALPSASNTERLTEIQGYTLLAPNAKKAVRLLVQYVDEVTVSAQVPFTEIASSINAKHLSMDATTRRNLELVINSKDSSSTGTLFSAINRTVTASAALLLKNWLLHPLCDLPGINQRLDAVEALSKSSNIRSDLKHALKPLSDLERIAARIELALALPIELAAVRDSLQQAAKITAVLTHPQLEQIELLHELIQQLHFPEELLNLLVSSLADQIPASNYSGKIFRAGFDSELDRLCNLKESGAAWMMQLEARERELTGINSLKIRHNNVHGYFIEVTKANVTRAPDHYIRKQTTVNSERFFIPELKEMEQQLYSADDKLAARERELLALLIGKLKIFSETLRKMQLALASVDVINSLAELAEELDLQRPLVDESRDISIVAGRHPVLLQLLGNRLIPNSLELDSKQFCAVITGANMGGKSTYLRQTALIVILGQIGSFVPAQAARFGMVDQLFARLGASDDMLEGESTFMVEMREAAHIIGHATERSLLLIDEIGRGTATTDGLAIARAMLEWIVTRITCRSLFATHFHELTVLDQGLPALKNLSVATVEAGDSFLFTHEIKNGAADRSYGLEVAKLAGLPGALLRRAKVILDSINSTEQAASGSRQLSLFATSATDVGNNIFPETDQASGQETDNKLSARVVSAQESAVLNELLALDLNAVTPLDALIQLNKLQKALNDN